MCEELVSNQIKGETYANKQRNLINWTGRFNRLPTTQQRARPAIASGTFGQIDLH